MSEACCCCASPHAPQASLVRRALGATTAGVVCIARGAEALWLPRSEELRPSQSLQALIPGPVGLCAARMPRHRSPAECRTTSASRRWSHYSCAADLERHTGSRRQKHRQLPAPRTWRQIRLSVPSAPATAEVARDLADSAGRRPARWGGFGVAYAAPTGASRPRLRARPPRSGVP